MSLPRFTEVDRLSSTKMGIARFLIQIHNLYPGNMALYYAAFNTVFNWTLDELVRLKNDKDDRFPSYSESLVNALELAGEPVKIYEDRLRIPYHFSLDREGDLLK